MLNVPQRYQSLEDQLVKQYHNINKPYLIKHFKSFFSKLLKSGVITPENRDKLKRPVKIFDDNHYAAYKPKLISIEVTNRCNLFCPHCSVNAGPNNPNELPYEIIIKQVQALKRKFKTNRIHITGGEPFIRDGIINFLTELSNMGFIISVNSNGIAIKEKDIDTLASAVHNLVITLYGSSQKTYKHFGDKNQSFQKLKSNLIRLGQTMKNKLDVTLMMEKKNYRDLNALMKFCTHNNLNYHVSHVSPFGRGFKNQNSICLSKIEISQIYDKKLFQCSEQRNDDTQIFRKFPCRRDLVSIRSDGDFSFCPLFDDSELSLGNIYMDDISEVWLSKKTRAKLSALSVDNREFCSHCEYKYRCGGGCLILSKNYLGRHSAPFPFCEVFKNHEYIGGKHEQSISTN